MPLRKRTPDTLSMVAILIEAYANRDATSVERARQLLVPASTSEIFDGLYRFGQFLAQADLNPEQIEIITEILAGEFGSPEMTAAVRGVGRALLLERTELAYIAAMRDYIPLLAGSKRNDARLMSILLAEVMGDFCRRIGMKLNFR